MRLINIGSLIGLLLTLTTPSMAAFSGLTMIPTADTVGANQYSIGFQTDGSIQNPNTETRFFNTEIGITDRFEAGVDFDIGRFADDSAVLNAKYVFLTDNKRQFYMAAGIGGVESRTKPLTFIAATKVVKYARLHFGGLRLEGNNRWFVGADKALGDKWTIMADYTNGDENYSSLAANYQLTDNFGIMLGAEFPNVTGETIYTLQFSLSGSIMRSPPGETAKQ